MLNNNKFSLRKYPRTYDRIGKTLKKFIGPRFHELQTRIAESLVVRYHHRRLRGMRLEDLSSRRQRHHNIRHRYVQSPTIAFAVTEHTSTTLAGDAFSAMGLATALGKLGWTSLFLPQRPHNRWYENMGEPHLLVAMRHDFRLDQMQGRLHAITIAWVRNRVDQWLNRPWLQNYDMVLCSGYAALQQIDRTLPDKRQYRGVLHLAADPDRFYPTGGRADMESDICFVGNFYHIRRDIERYLTVQDGWRFKVWGNVEYATHPFKPYQQGTIRYDEVNRIYNSAKIVLEDCTPMCRPWGCFNSRTFEAMLSGACVISNPVPGLRTLFPEGLLVYRSGEELTRLIRRYLADDDKRENIGKQARLAVLKAHTYDHRALEFKRHLQRYLGMCA